MTKPMPQEDKERRAAWRKLVRRLNKKFGTLGLVSEPIRKMIAAEIVDFYDERRKTSSDQ